jgi:enoyl-CoA hydratase/carnithine racemase
MNAAYIRVGLGGCDMGAGYLLPRLVGVSNASEFLLSGRFINAERALRMGLVSEIVPLDKLLETGLALAHDMLKAAPMGLRMTKEAINAEIDAPSLEAALAIEDRQQVILIDTDDHREAVKAFREKRAPAFRDA